MITETFAFTIKLLYNVLILSAPYTDNEWGLIGYMGPEILATNGKFIFNTPIARHKQSSIDGKTCSFAWDNFCWEYERMSGSIASYQDFSYQIGMLSLS